MDVNKIKLSVLAIMLYTAGSAQNYDFTYKAYETQLQMKPVTQQQYITFGVAAIGGGAIAKFVEEQTERKWVGILAAVAFGFMGGLIVDDNDGKQLASYDFTQTPHAYNDAVAGALGGLTGSLTLNIKLFGGRGKSKNGFNGRYNKRKRR